MKFPWALVCVTLCGCPAKDSGKTTPASTASPSAASSADLPRTKPLPLPPGDPTFSKSYNGSYEALDGQGKLLCKVEVKDDAARIEVHEAGKSARVVVGVKRGGSRRYSYEKDGKPSQAMLRKVKRRGSRFSLLGPDPTMVRPVATIRSHALTIALWGGTGRSHPPLVWKWTGKAFVRFAKQKGSGVVAERLGRSEGKVKLYRGERLLAQADEKGDKLHWAALALPKLSLTDRCMVAAELIARGL